MTNTQQQIRNRVADIARKKRMAPRGTPLRALDVQIPEKEKGQFFGAFLMTCIVLLFVATLAMLYVKDGKGLDVFRSETVASNDVAQPQAPKPVVPIAPETGLDTRVAQLEKDMKVFEHRVWLLGLATNENANLSKQMDKAHHRVTDRGFVTLDQNWKLNPVPKSMQLTPEQKQRIEQGVPK